MSIKAAPLIPEIADMDYIQTESEVDDLLLGVRLISVFFVIMFPR